MIKIISLSSAEIDKEIKKLRKKERESNRRIEKEVASIVNQVMRDGDKALASLSKKFDKITIRPKDFEIEKTDINNSVNLISKDVKAAIDKSYKRIKEYQVKKMPKSFKYKDNLENILGWTINPIEKIGIYVPGGTAAYPSTLLMTATLAQVAGSKEIYVVTPPSNNKVSPSILYAAKVTGVKKIYKVGGAQAIAALAFGTKTIPKVDKIVGPGNAYVATAKKQVFGDVDIDMIAGPSEVLIIADKTSDPKLIAADLIAQAEHDIRSSAILATDSAMIAKETAKELVRQSKVLPRKNIIQASLKNNGRIYILSSLKGSVKLANEFAPEHLQIIARNANSLSSEITSAGSIFLGKLSAEAFGDYIAGPSHVLPTSGNAKFSSPLSVLDFLKYSSLTKISKKGANSLAPLVIALAKEEGLHGHAMAALLRLTKGES
ncbi:MAG: histidinol dehydrogenase [Thermodesulfobacteriota bacterium]|nr:histidinol dehydrogenase [Thermodesulfobacteriota bacterium]